MIKFTNKKALTTILVLFSFVIIFSSCKKSEPAPTTGKLTGKVTELSSGNALAEVAVVLFDASNNSPVGNASTDTNGDYTMDVDPGTYFLKFYKQGYNPVPPPGITPIQFDIAVGATTTQPAEMSVSTLTNVGMISGKVLVGTAGQSGVLVVAENGGTAFSAISDTDGNYSIFNVPAASYNVQGYLASYSSTTVAAPVTSGTTTADVNVDLTMGVSGSVSGTFKVISQTTIATDPATMDISLIHPITNETIPGLSQDVPYSSSLNFSFSDVPDGNYVIRASYANDYIVIDPDYITKFGEYTVSVSGGTATPATIDIVATSAVILSSPTNEMTSTIPVDASATPTFTWSPYPSTSDYVIEVTDASTGQVIWGGFTDNGGTLTKNIVIPSNTTSVDFDFDGNASAALVSGKIYRWRVYASKDNSQTSSWNLIAASEDQVGLIKIQ